MPSCHTRDEILLVASRVLRDVVATSAGRTLLQIDDSVAVTGQTGQVAFWRREGNPTGKAALHLLRSHVVSTEARHPGSGDLCAAVGASVVDLWVRRERAGEDPAVIAGEVSSAIDAVSRQTIARRRLRLEDLPQMLEAVPARSRELAIEMIGGSQLGTTVAVRRSRLAETSVRRVLGCGIRVSVDPRLMSQPVLDSPRVVLFDGTIDTVGQIHRVLEDSSRTGQHYLIVCRDASHEVVQTVALNSARGTVRAILVQSRLDDLTVGALEDACEYLGAWTITAQSGESVSSAFDRLTTAPGRVWLEGETLRCDAPPSEGLGSHLARLRSDASTGDQSVADFLGARISALSASRVEILLGVGDVRSDPTLVERVDSEVRALSAAFTRGVTDEHCLPPGISPSLESSIASHIPRGARSAGSVPSGMCEGLRFARALCTIGHAVFV